MRGRARPTNTTSGPVHDVTEVRKELARLARELLQPEWQARRQGRQRGDAKRIHGFHALLREQDDTIDLCDGFPVSTDLLQALNGQSRLRLGGGRRGCTICTTTGSHRWSGLGQGRGSRVAGRRSHFRGVLKEAVDRRGAEIQADIKNAPPLTPPMDEYVREAPGQAAAPKSRGARSRRKKEDGMEASRHANPRRRFT